jgi:ubiquinone/menaquinone biosynthesis C-methylase UbiE/DNA-binding transcriptional ArsR family regulator
MKTFPAPQSLTDQLAALGEMLRLRVLRLLEREELSVGELAKVVQYPQSTVSRHLKVLADGGWVVRRSEGTATFYRVVLDDLPLPQRTLWLTVRDQLVNAPGPSSSGELSEDLRRLASVLAERREDAQTYFGRVAGQWDQVRTELFGSRFALHGLLTLLPRDWTVVDVGCGTGNAAEILAPLVRRVIAIDQSAPMLAAAQKRLQDAGNVEFMQADLQRLPLADGTAHAAVCVLVLHHAESPSLAIAEMARVLKPGGMLLVIDMLAHDRTSYRHTMGHRWLGFAQPELEQWAREAGLSEPRAMPLPSDTQALGPGLFALTAQKPAEEPA